MSKINSIRNVKKLGRISYMKYYVFVSKEFKTEITFAVASCDKSS